MAWRVFSAVLVVAMIAYGLHPAGALLSLCLLCLMQVSLIVALDRKRLLRRVLLSTTALTLALVLVEMVALHVWPIAPHRILPRAGSPVASTFSPDPELGRVFTPDFQGYFVHPEYNREAIEINSDGFRGEPWPRPMPEQGPRVLVLGDSMTLGFGVEVGDSIPALLEGLLQESRRAARVFNAGVPGYGPRHERVLLERLIDRVRPTHVIVIFYDGNDLKNCRVQLEMERRKLAEVPAQPVATYSRPPSLLSPKYWARRSALGHRLEAAMIARKTARGVLKHHAFDGILSVTRRNLDGEVAEELQLAIEAVTQMSSRCAQLDTQFLFVRMPMRVQTEVESFDTLVRFYGHDVADHDRELPGRALIEACDESSVHALDLLPLIEVPGKGPNMNYYPEGHPNRRGNRAIARHILECMLSKGLLK